MYTPMHASTHARTCAHTHTHTHARTHARTHALTHSHTHTHTHTRTHARTHTHTHARTHARTHTHTHTHQYGTHVPVARLQIGRAETMARHQFIVASIVVNYKQLNREIHTQLGVRNTRLVRTNDSEHNFTDCLVARGYSARIVNVPEMKLFLIEMYPLSRVYINFFTSLNIFNFTIQHKLNKRNTRMCFI